MADYNKKTLFPAPCADIESSVSTSEASYIDKCECYIHSLKKDGQSVLAEATIIERIGDNQYLADYNGVKCTAIFNPFVGRYYVDDKYGVVSDHKEHDRGR